VATNDKTPLQAVVSVLCDALCELPLEDQQRALEAVAITLGIQPRPSSLPAALSRNVIDEITTALTPAAARYRDGRPAGGSFRNGNGASVEVRPLRDERLNLPEASPFVLRNQPRAAR
jgi:hypothetical protein